MKRNDHFWQPRGNEFGIAHATVVNTKDPAGLGRIKVEFEMKLDREGKKIQSNWIQFASPFAGQEFGMFFMPEPGAPALVAFSGSDPSRAYVIGFVWNGKNKPPVEEMEQKSVRVIRTKSGKKITIDESKESAKIEIKDENDNEITIDSKNNSINIKCNSGVTIDAGEGSVDIKCIGDMSINASGQLSIKAAAVSLQAEAEMQLKAGQIFLN